LGLALILTWSCNLGCERLSKTIGVLTTPRETKETIKLGILHSQTGSMGMNEMSLRHSEVLAIEEINSSGEFPKTEFVPVVRDGRSKSDHFRRRVRNLIDVEKVDVIFGCWTSLHRKAVIDEMANPTDLFRPDGFVASTAQTATNRSCSTPFNTKASKPTGTFFILAALPTNKSFQRSIGFCPTKEENVKKST
jgi:ABC-type branched-subunit amino acid transport system substrate-binding protein